MGEPEVREVQTTSEAQVTLFDGATYYDTDDDCERLTHESPDEAIEAYVDRQWDNSLSDEANFEAIGPVTVYAWTRDTVSDAELVTYASWAADAFAEHFGDNHGAPDRDDDDAYMVDIVVGFIQVVRRVMKPEHVWQCTRVAEREYDEAAVKKAVE